MSVGVAQPTSICTHFSLARALYSFSKTACDMLGGSDSQCRDEVGIGGVEVVEDGDPDIDAGRMLHGFGETRPKSLRQ